MRGYKNRAVASGLLMAYLMVLLAATFLARPSAANVAPRLVAASKLWHVADGQFDPEVLTNVLMLAPVGLLLPSATGWNLGRTTLATLLVASGIECTQYATSRGCFDVTDIVLNALGAMVGYGLWALYHAIANRGKPRPKHMR